MRDKMPAPMPNQRPGVDAGWRVLSQMREKFSSRFEESACHRVGQRRSKSAMNSQRSDSQFVPYYPLSRKVFLVIK